MEQKLSPAFEAMIRGAATASADDVLRLSEYFLSRPGDATPWSESFTVPAYINYYLPLNYARLASVFREVRRFVPPDAISEIWDFGSGPGTTHWVLEDCDWLPPRPLICLETAKEAMATHRRLMELRQPHWRPTFGRDARPAAGAMAVFSYSFLEMQKAPPDLRAFEHLLIVEPSTRECGRQLMEWRGRLLAQGFHVLAPCTHAQACPLLVHSQRDWCHMRIGFSAPQWWLELEDELPMKNRTLTYSYLLMSRSVQPHASKPPHSPAPARVIGDTLEERGKTRQMICRGPEREFLSWLHRNGEPPRVPHGALLEGTEKCETKGGGELRVPAEAALRWTE